MTLPDSGRRSLGTVDVNGAAARRPPSRFLTRVRDLPVLVQDGGIVAVVLLVQFIALATTGPDRLPSGEVARPIDAGAYVLIAVATVPLLARRRWPYGSLACTLAALLAFAAIDYAGIFVGYAILVAVYSVSAHRGLRAGIVAAVVTLVALYVSYQIASWEPNAADNAFDLLAVATAVALGDGTRNRVRVADEQAARLAAVASEQDRIAQQTVMNERARIARELHDLVAHSMSIVAVQAGMGHHLIDRDPAKAKDALAAIETTSRQALTEMRRMLGVLRTPADDHDGEHTSLDPQPGSTDISVLVSDAAGTGLDVELVIEPADATLDLPSGVALSAFRIVQEALTNVRKHAGPANVCVTLRRDAERLGITVDDDGRGVSTMVSDRGGFGLIGMRERASVVGGQLSAGPRPGGGFRVHATLPIREST